MGDTGYVKIGKQRKASWQLDATKVVVDRGFIRLVNG